MDWDLQLVTIGSKRGSGIAPLAQLLQADPRIEAVAIDDSPPLTVANQKVFALVVDDLKATWRQSSKRGILSRSALIRTLLCDAGIRRISGQHHC